MTHYLLSPVQPANAQPLTREQRERIRADVQNFHAELRAAGAWVFASPLADPDTATMVRAADQEVTLTDGAWTGGSEHVAGVCIVAAPDLDAALRWGGMASRATGLAVEVRPFATT